MDNKVKTLCSSRKRPNLISLTSYVKSSEVQQMVILTRHSLL